MDVNSDSTASLSATLTPIVVAARENEVKGREIFQKTTDEFTLPRVNEVMSEINADQPSGVKSPKSSKAPIIIFVHGGSLSSGTYLDSIGSAKVGYFIDKGYTFATVNYTLIPSVTVEEQVQDVANSISHLVGNETRLDIDSERLILMGHSSGAHVVTLLGTDSSYLERAGTSISIIQAVITLDGSNYNAAAELLDNPGPIVENMIYRFGTDLKRLTAMSPTYHAHAPNARAFLLLHAHRHGDIRQTVELSVALNAAGTDVRFHVFEGQGFEGQVLDGGANVNVRSDNGRTLAVRHGHGELVALLV
ncbi:hypothetical protein ASPVEDRAFT_86621 [Aspergillus versicolor CBS 583.65]|uniref:BD-FAE-like domain-containing protein n=1 Tax=Aspergillus versicolor CBS 583.65 TaxID=1036611 RepID=A0A1L9PUN6_ASPVE|nr:uncharacterized protein ASPVEDRAFT_86621 [Aspergillus versicolor CBS 583.65]OJJ05269.1 hypothetical protein ASPVEDRAFT_86621 [Aspergillus versicolor CBS 583.65]